MSNDTAPAFGSPDEGYDQNATAPTRPYFGSIGEGTAKPGWLSEEEDARRASEAHTASAAPSAAARVTAAPTPAAPAPVAPARAAPHGARVDTILWGVTLTAFAAYLGYTVVAGSFPDPVTWIIGTLVVGGAALVLIGIAAAVRRAR